jgi:hypothetical protein
MNDKFKKESKMLYELNEKFCRENNIDAEISIKCFLSLGFSIAETAGVDIKQLKKIINILFDSYIYYSANEEDKDE